MTTAAKEPTNGAVPLEQELLSNDKAEEFVIEAPKPLTPEQAALKVLEAEANKRMSAYNAGLIQLTEQTGYAVAPAIELPGGELVLLSSWLAALGIKANPRLKIVPK